MIRTAKSLIVGLSLTLVLTVPGCGSGTETLSTCPGPACDCGNGETVECKAAACEVSVGASSNVTCTEGAECKIT